MGSLAGAVHLVNDNPGVQSEAHVEQKSTVEHKSKSLIDFHFQCECEPRNRGLTILLLRRACGKRCQKSYHRDNWLVAYQSPNRLRFLILRCRLLLSFNRSRLKVSDCSSINSERELGLDRRETG